MKTLRWLLPAFLLLACQAQGSRTVTIRDGDETRTISTSETMPLLILNEAGITAQPTDRVLVNGVAFGLEDEISLAGNLDIQLFRTVSVRLISPQMDKTILTSAMTVADVLNEDGIVLGSLDEVRPPLTTPITDR